MSFLEIENLHNYIELLPVCFVGIFAGFISYLQIDAEEKKQGSFKHILRVVITSSFLTLVVFSILTATNLPYLACVGISAGVGYFGIDKAIDLAQKLINLKGSKETKK